jgi:dTDP-4-amino-4,6-dideoxygalactose transaminase
MSSFWYLDSIQADLSLSDDICVSISRGPKGGLKLTVMLQINDLQARVEENYNLISASVQRVITSGYFILGPEVKNFENMFSKYLGAEHCVGLANGTDAIEVGLRALGIKRGDVVATVANAGMYTTTAVLAIGAVPYFMDVDLDTMLVTFEQVERAIKAKVNAIVVTHLYGLAIPDIESIAALAKVNNIPLLEDCAQAHGALHKGKRVGTFGDVGSFSFYPTKNLGALGDGGAICANAADVAELAKKLRQYGWKEKYSVQLLGARNSRLDEMQAAVLSAFLPLLDDSNRRRREIAKTYSLGIDNPNIICNKHYGEDYVAHLFVIRSKERDSLKEHLLDSEVMSDVHYPIPDHKQSAILEMIPSHALGNTELLSKEVLTLPCYPEMTRADVNFVIDVVNAWAP